MTSVPISADQSTISGPFNWSHKAETRLDEARAGSDWRLAASHDGYEKRFGLVHVDFETLATAARAAGAAHSRLTTQGVFLERLGIAARAQALAARLSGPARDEPASAHRRLTHGDEMGNLFKVLGVFPPHAAPPPGLDA